MQNTLWFNHKPKIQLEQKPVLDQNRNRIITYDRNILQQQLQKYLHDDDSKYLKDRGYEVLGEIGRGGYGVVYKAKSIKQPTKLYAIKKNFDVVARSTIYLQVAFFHLVRKKRNLPRMLDLFFIGQTPYVILQYFEHQPYQEIFDSVTTLNEVKHYMMELLKGINTLKNLGIYHRDIKPHNFLYNRVEKKGIIIDFGLAEIDPDFVEKVVQKRYIELYKKIPQKQRKKNQELNQKKNEWNLYKKILKANEDHGFSKIGTQSYVSLQTLLNNRDQGHECEIWSAGVIFMQFLSQKIHFFNQPKITNIENSEYIKYISIFVMELAQIFGRSEVEQQMGCMNWKLVFPKNMQDRGNIRKMMMLKSTTNQKQNQLSFDLLMKMIALKPQERITVEDAIWHQFFDQVREEHFQSTSERKWYVEQYERRRVKSDQQIQRQENIEQSMLNDNRSFSVNPGQSEFSRSFSKTTNKKYDQNSASSSSENSISSHYIQKYKQKKMLEMQNQSMLGSQKNQYKSNKKYNKQQQIVKQQSKNSKQNYLARVQIKQHFKISNIKQPNKATLDKKTKNPQNRSPQKTKKQDRIVVDSGYEPPKVKVLRKPPSKASGNKNQNHSQKLVKQTENMQNQNQKPALTLQQLLKKQEERLQKQRNQDIKSITINNDKKYIPSSSI